MKPTLLIGLGNVLMGDDGVGCRLADLLAADPRLPPDVEALAGGSDLLRHASDVEGRRRVVLIDAVESADAAPGTVTVLKDGLEERQAGAHCLSVPQAMKILELVCPVSFTLLGISVAYVNIGQGLSPALEENLPSILTRVLEEVRWISSS